MKRFVLSAFVFAAALSAQPVTYTIDPAHSSADFSVKHMMVSTVRGSFTKTTGAIVYDANNLSASSVEAVVDATSVSTRVEARDNHLKSPDFFDVAKFPTLTFKSKQWYKEGGALKIKGDFTLHGVTREVVLAVDGPSPEIKAGNAVKIGASASVKISRKDYGLVWNRAVEAGGVAVSDEVTITLDIEANKK